VAVSEANKILQLKTSILSLQSSEKNDDHAELTKVQR